MNKYANIAVFLDGTGNNDFTKPVSGQTNVARLWKACEAIQNSGDLTQNTLYRPGVGTNRTERLRGSVRGAFLEDRVNAGLSFLKNEISIAKEDGFVPRVFIFGFSRGAYAARCLASRLDYEVEFLGVWDTVKATVTGPDVSEVSPNVRSVFHAIAIDEHRKIFDVMHFKDSSKVVEVWFPGCHSDVGGGYPDGTLSYAPLNWIATEAKRHGLLLDESLIPSESDYEVDEPVIHDETKDNPLWKGLANLSFGSKFNRVITSSDYVYSSVVLLRVLGYSPDYLPQNCVVWNPGRNTSNIA